MSQPHIMPDKNILRKIAVTLAKCCEDTKDFPFGMDLEGAQRLFTLMGIDLNAEESVDLSSLADDLGA